MEDKNPIKERLQKEPEKEVVIYCEICNRHVDTESEPLHFEVDNDGEMICAESVLDGICHHCNGSGEGGNEFIRCMACKGTGSLSWGK